MSAPGLDPWDDVILDGRHAPGMCTVLTYGLPGGATFQVECVFAWTRENWEQLQAWIDVAWNRGKPRPGPVSAEHPALQLWAVRKALVTSVTVPVTVKAPLGLEHVDCEWKMVKLTLVEAV